MTGLWTTVISDLGSVTIDDVVGGVVNFSPSDGTVADNDEVYLHTPNEIFLLDDGRPMYAAAVIQFAEAATNACNVFVGWANAFAADLIVDNGGGPRTSGTIICLEKRDGELNWRLTTRNGSNVTTSLSQTVAGSANWQLVEINVSDFSSTEMKITAQVNGVPLRDSTTGLEIVHTRLVASATEMHFGFGLKNGSTTEEAMLLDWTGAWQRRRNVGTA